MGLGDQSYRQIYIYLHSDFSYALLMSHARRSQSFYAMMAINILVESRETTDAHVSNLKVSVVCPTDTYISIYSHGYPLERMSWSSTRKIPDKIQPTHP